MLNALNALKLGTHIVYGLILDTLGRYAAYKPKRNLTRAD